MPLNVAVFSKNLAVLWYYFPQFNGCDPWLPLAEIHKQPLLIVSCVRSGLNRFTTAENAHSVVR